MASFESAIRAAILSAPKWRVKHFPQLPCRIIAVVPLIALRNLGGLPYLGAAGQRFFWGHAE